MVPQITLDHEGFHNKSDYTSRLEKSKTYQDLSTICLVPTRGVIPAKVVQNWMSMMTPMNQKFMRMFMIGMEVGAAYSQAVDNILAHPELSKWKYVLCLEEDNMPPPDGALKLYESIGDFGGVGGLYWTKGPEGQPMCYGNPRDVPINFIPQIPAPDSLTECNGLGMGFTLLKIEMLHDLRSKLTGAMFQTLQVYEPGKGIQGYTQDLYFYQKAREHGYKFACDSRVKVGHYSIEQDICW